MDTEAILTGLRAAAEPTRLRIVALCAESELTVSELTQILGQSQPRVSRHLKVLCEAGLLDRSREGTSAFFRLARNGDSAELARHLTALLTREDRTRESRGDAPEALDFERLEAVKKARAAAGDSRESSPRRSQASTSLTKITCWGASIGRVCAWPRIAESSSSSAENRVTPQSRTPSAT